MAEIVQIQPLYEDMKAFSERTGIRYGSIRVLCLRGQLPFVKIGVRRMIPVERGLQALERLEVEHED